MLNCSVEEGRKRRLEVLNYSSVSITDRERSGKTADFTGCVHTYNSLLV